MYIWVPNTFYLSNLNVKDLFKKNGGEVKLFLFITAYTEWVKSMRTA